MKKLLCGMVLLSLCLTGRVGTADWLSARYSQHRYIVETGVADASNPDPYGSYQSLLSSSQIGNVHFTDASAVTVVQGGSGSFPLPYADSLLIDGLTSLVVHPKLFDTPNFDNPVYSFDDIFRFTWATKTEMGFNPLQSITLWGADGILLADSLGATITSTNLANGFTQWSMSNFTWNSIATPSNPDEWLISFDFLDNDAFYLESYGIIMDNRPYSPTSDALFTTFQGNFSYTAPPAPVTPEPATMLVFGFGLAGLPFLRRRRK